MQWNKSPNNTAKIFPITMNKVPKMSFTLNGSFKYFVARIAFATNMSDPSGATTLCAPNFNAAALNIEPKK